MKTLSVGSKTSSASHRQHAEPVHRLWPALWSHESTADRIHAEYRIPGHAGRNGNERIRSRYATSTYGNALIDEDSVSADGDAIHGHRDGHVGHEHWRHAADDDGNAATTSTDRHVEFQRNEQRDRVLELWNGYVVSTDWYEQRRDRKHELLVSERASPVVSTWGRYGGQDGAANDGLPWSNDCTAYRHAA
jgi:hypothetical protein